MNKYSTKITVMNLLMLLKPHFYISKGTTVNGSISSDNSGSVNGTVNGDVTAHAQLTIERNGIINGDVLAKNVVVKGKIKGNIYCNGKVLMSKNGEVHGHIYAGEATIDKESLLKGGMAQLHAKEGDEITEQKEAAVEATAALANKPVVDETPQSWF
jgi:cytoskeletal protein CcmA (bactofilin family)